MREGQICFCYYSNNQKLVKKKKKKCLRAAEVHPVCIAGRCRSTFRKCRKSELYIEKAGVEGINKGVLSRFLVGAVVLLDM